MLLIYKLINTSGSPFVTVWIFNIQMRVGCCSKKSKHKCLTSGNEVMRKLFVWWNYLVADYLKCSRRLDTSVNQRYRSCRVNYSFEKSCWELATVIMMNRKLFVLAIVCLAVTLVQSLESDDVYNSREKSPFRRPPRQSLVALKNPYQPTGNTW